MVKPQALPPVSLVLGEAFLLERNAAAFLSEIRSRVAGEIAPAAFYLTETPLTEALGQARTLPFLASAQMIRLREAEALKEKHFEDLAAYLKHPAEKTFLVLESAQPEKASKLAEFLAGKAPVRVLAESEKRPAGSVLVREKLRRAGKTAEPEALRRLEEQAGLAPDFTDSFLEQVIVYAGEAKVVTERMLEDLRDALPDEPDPFRLADALLEGEPAKAIALARRLAADRNELIPLFGVLHWKLRQAWLVLRLTEDREPQETVFKKARISPGQAGFLLRRLRGVKAARLEKAVEEFFQLDRKMKSGQAEGLPEFESWLAKTASAFGRKAAV